MCDTMVVVRGAGGAVWFAKNSDREPSEAQTVEHLPAGPAPGPVLRATWVTVPESAPTFEVVLSRPAWMWGAEMGVNEHGVAIGNEAVFTKLPVARSGLTGMDLLRIALERSRTADDALERITGLLARYGQGGRCGHRHAGFRYHNAFVIADGDGAWLLETADRFWAAARVRGVRTTSNVLTLDEPELLGPGTLDEAKRRGFWDGDAPFSFRRAFGRVAMGVLSGGDVRRACSRRALSAGDDGAGTDLERCVRALRDHHGRSPHAGWRMEAPCAHASPLPTRSAGQTTGSMVACLRPGAPRVWSTGTSSPCLSVFKPIALGRGPTDLGPSPGVEADARSLWWRHERLHRAVMRSSYDAAKALFEDERAALEQAAWRASEGEPRDAAALWEEHRARSSEWASCVERSPRPRARGLSERAGRWFWSRAG